MAQTPNSEKPSAGGRAVESILLFAILFASWLILSGHYTPLAIGFGVIACILTLWLNKERPLLVGGLGRRFGIPLSGINFVRLILYPIVLFVDIVKANLHVAAIIISPRLPIDPAFIQFRTELKRSIPQTIFGNHITLTPGTITVDIEDGRYLVHTLNPKLVGDLTSGSLVNRIAAMLGEPQGPPTDMTEWTRSVKDLSP
jgi:multicomponent Na+:H+ antiporter subunit E